MCTGSSIKRKTKVLVECFTTLTRAQSITFDKGHRVIEVAAGCGVDLIGLIDVWVKGSSLTLVSSGKHSMEFADDVSVSFGGFHLRCTLSLSQILVVVKVEAWVLLLTLNILWQQLKDWLIVEIGYEDWVWSWRHTWSWQNRGQNPGIFGNVFVVADGITIHYKVSHIKTHFRVTRRNFKSITRIGKNQSHRLCRSCRWLYEDGNATQRLDWIHWADDVGKGNTVRTSSWLTEFCFEYKPRTNGTYRPTHCDMAVHTMKWYWRTH